MISETKSIRVVCKFCFLVFGVFLFSNLYAAQVRIKELTRVEGIRDNQLIGYGLVIGLAGTGDTSRNRASMQSILNTLSNFGVSVSQQDLSSRNVAAVAVTAVLPAFAQAGDKLDVNVSSLGDARSLTGGTLIQTPLKGANGEIFALAQGSVSVGGFSHDVNGNLVQKNHPTVGVVPGGALVERMVNTHFTQAANKDSKGEYITLVLEKADFTTANRIRERINEYFEDDVAAVINPAKINVRILGTDAIVFVSQIENLAIQPDQTASVVINERTGTIVSGGLVQIDDITISHGNIRVVVATRFSASQPTLIGNAGENVSSLLVSNSMLDVKEDQSRSIMLQDGTSINDLVMALKQIQASTRDIISILQAIKSAGALHAEIIIK